MSNIGIVTTWFDRGAAYVSKAYLDILRPKHKVFIYARGGELYGKDDPNWNHDNVTWGKRIKLGVPGFIHWQDFKQWLDANQIEILIFNEQQSWDVILKILKSEIRFGTYVDYYTPETVPYFYLYDFLLCNTKRHYHVFQDHPQAIYIPWGTNCDIYNGSCLPTSTEQVTFFHSCGYSPYRKGTDLLLKSFQTVDGKAQLIIHAQIPIKDNVLNNQIKNDPRIHLIIETVPAPGLYHLGDVYVYPSRLEGIGLTILEALASGLPVITTDNPPMNEFVIPEISGKLVKVEKFQRRSDNYYWDESICSTAALSAAMQYYVDNQLNLRNYKQTAREYAVRNLDWFENSKNFRDQVTNIKSIPKRPELLTACAWYEYKRYPKLFLDALVRKFKPI